MTFYLLRPCSGHAAYEALLKKQIKIELAESADTLRKNGYEVLDAKIMLIAKKNDVEITIYPSARLLIKCQLEEQASQLANEIFGVLGVKTAI